MIIQIKFRQAVTHPIPYIYDGMKRGAESIKIERSAESLHYAVRLLQDQICQVQGFPNKIDDDPLVWAPYIHIEA